MSIWLELLLFGTTLELAAAALPDGVALQRDVVAPALGDDTTFFGEASPGAITGGETVMALTVERSDGDLLAAQRDAASVLEKFAALHAASQWAADAETVTPEIIVVDVLALDARPLLRAIERLRAEPPQSMMWIGTRPVGEGEFEVETFGLRKLMQREIHIPKVREEHLSTVSRFLNKLALYVFDTEECIEPGHRSSFGWVDVHLVAAESLPSFADEPGQCAPRYIRQVGTRRELPGVLVVFEPVNDESDSAIRSGVERAASIVAQMTSASSGCGLSEGIVVPRGRDTAVVCKRVNRPSGVTARRLPLAVPTDSGWVVICDESDHDHDDAASFEEVPLLELARRCPALFSMLAVPAGTGLVLGGGGELTILLPELAELGS